MKENWLCLVMAALLILAISGGQVFGAEESENQPTLAEVRVDFLSAYVWRGITLNDGFVVQPALDLLHPLGLGFNVWGNVDIGDYDGRYEKEEISEVDLAVRYELPLKGPLSLAVAYAEYLYPKEGNYTPMIPLRNRLKIRIRGRCRPSSRLRRSKICPWIWESIGIWMKATVGMGTPPCRMCTKSPKLSH